MKIFIYIFVYFEQEYKVCRGVKKKIIIFSVDYVRYYR